MTIAIPLDDQFIRHPAWYEKYRQYTWQAFCETVKTSVWSLDGAYTLTKVMNKGNQALQLLGCQRFRYMDSRLGLSIFDPCYTIGSVIDLTLHHSVDHRHAIITTAFKVADAASNIPSFLAFFARKPEVFLNWTGNLWLFLFYDVADLAANLSRYYDVTHKFVRFTLSDKFKSAIDHEKWISTFNIAQSIAALAISILTFVTAPMLFGVSVFAVTVLLGALKPIVRMISDWIFQFYFDSFLADDIST